MACEDDVLSTTARSASTKSLEGPDTRRLLLSPPPPHTPVFPPTSTLSAILRAAPILTLPWTQFGSARTSALVREARGRKTCAPRQAKIWLATASATAAGSMMAAPRRASSCSTGARSGVRTHEGWMEVVRMPGALWERVSSWESAGGVSHGTLCGGGSVLTLVERQHGALCRAVVRHACDADVARRAGDGDDVAPVLRYHVRQEGLDCGPVAQHVDIEDLS